MPRTDQTEVARERPFRLTQPMRYAAAGLAATACHFTTLVLLVERHSLTPGKASAIGFAVAIAVNYALQYRWTFRANGPHRVTFLRYLAVTLAMLGVNSVLFWLLYNRAGMSYLLAQALVTGLIFVLNFHINRRFTFASRR